MTPTTNTEYPRPPAKLSYDVSYGCANCGWSGKQHFCRGEAAPQTVKCPKCGCNTAKKSVALPYVPRRRAEPVDPPPWPLRLPRPFDPRPRWAPYCEIVGTEERA